MRIRFYKGEVFNIEVINIVSVFCSLVYQFFWKSYCYDENQSSRIICGIYRREFM